MVKDFMAMPRVNIDIDAGFKQGTFEWWRHSLGHGAVNSTPLPERVVAGVRKLKPRLIRIFLQEYFEIYPDHGVFDWSKLDPYMEALAQTGAKVIATINFKPPVLYPKINHSIWKPNNIEEWQNMIYQLVRRYSVEKPIVTHWEHVNEPDIGEQGGCPFYIPTAEENFEFYTMMIKPILEASPDVKVGGPAMASYNSPILKGFVELCHKNKTPLDFVSWHSYNDNPVFFKEQVEFVRKIVDIYGNGKRPDLMLNEMNKGFDFQDMANPSYFLVSVEDQALAPRRAAHTVASILNMMETELDWSQYFLIWDCCMHPGEFKTFFSEEGARRVMYKHWNETPHRFGLFSEGEAVRPQYFAYQLLSRMGEEKAETVCSDKDIKAQAVSGDGKLSVIMSNYSLQSTRDIIITCRFANLQPGMKKLTVYRIDDEKRWNSEELELIPVEQRMVDTMSDFEYQCYCPGDSIVCMTLES